jgi:hypothetical protein
MTTVCLKKHTTLGRPGWGLQSSWLSWKLRGHLEVDLAVWDSKK